MSKVTHEMLDRLAALVRLEIPAESREAYLEDFARMLNFVDQLSAIDTTGVEPLIHPIEETVPGAPDQPVTGTDSQAIVGQAPGHDSQYFRVPKVLKK
jgi:aspartyl-tRNA(Asn)/glutamyl-tRNA(Gln) amidotransferase subunit C